MTLDSVKKLFDENEEIACDRRTSRGGNMGVVPPDSTFMKGLRKLTEEEVPADF